MTTEIDVKMVKTETFWDFKGEDYVDRWLWMRSPVNMLVVLMGYWLFVFYLGPEYMKNKPAFKISRILALYNIAQIGLSCYLCYIGTKLLLTHGIINSTCHLEDEAVRYSIISGCYIYHLAKLTELLDTVFFVLKKNYRQVTFLHVYHHTIMYFCTWFTVKYEPTYSIVFICTLNSAVHVVMYTYYYLSAFPDLSKYLWWKKYITAMQIIQFVIILIQMGADYHFSVCPPSYTLQAAIISNVVLIMGMFINFYVSAYKK